MPFARSSALIAFAGWQWNSPGAVVAGPLRFEREVDLYVHRSARIGPVTGAEPVIFDTDTAPRD